MKNIIMILLFASLAITMKGQSTIDGYVYYNSDTLLPVSDVTLQLKKTSDNTILRNPFTTNLTGYFKFDSVPDGKYIIMCTTAHAVGGINPIDALIVNRYYIKLYKFSYNLKKLAADVNADKKINPIDALIINRRYIKLLNAFKAGDWLFGQDTITVNGSNVTHNIEGLCYGDVDGSYTCPNCGDNFIDNRDSISYKTVEIGTQCWMAQNLNAIKYINGDSIPNVTDNTSWLSLSTGAYCNYNNDINNAATYGRLYNWFAVNDSRNLCPSGWHVPIYAEWDTLISYLGGSNVAGGKMKEAGTTHWNSPNMGATNSSGFTGLPSGIRDFVAGSFGALGNAGVWWSATGINTTNAWYCTLSTNQGPAYLFNSSKTYGMSVRCVKD